MLIRPARSDEGALIAAISREARVRAMPWLAVRHSKRQDIDYFTHTVLAEQAVLIAEDAGERAGFAAVGGPWLNHLYVAPRHWRSGIGTALLKKVQANHDQLELWTFQQNEGARRFYARHGFREVEYSDGHRNEEHEPDVRMVWQRA
ncbi:MAG: GNAT family N-acetyltransferase [Henriciella sp.]